MDDSHKINLFSLIGFGKNLGLQDLYLIIWK